MLVGTNSFECPLHILPLGTLQLLKTTTDTTLQFHRFTALNKTAVIIWFVQLLPSICANLHRCRSPYNRNSSKDQPLTFERLAVYEMTSLQMLYAILAELLCWRVKFGEVRIPLTPLHQIRILYVCFCRTTGKVPNNIFDIGPCPRKDTEITYDILLYYCLSLVWAGLWLWLYVKPSQCLATDLKIGISDWQDTT